MPACHRPSPSEACSLVPNGQVKSQALPQSLAFTLASVPLPLKKYSEGKSDLFGTVCSGQMKKKILSGDN